MFQVMCAIIFVQICQLALWLILIGQFKAGKQKVEFCFILLQMARVNV